MKKFSIIVVTLNSKYEFLKTLDSIKKQSFRDYELVIVDGKSEDGTVDIIKKLNDTNIKSISEKDEGIYDAMNKGIDNSTGEWIIFLNSGDIFYNNEILKKISDKQIKNHDILFGDTVVNNKYFKYLIKSEKFSKNTYLIPFSHQSTFVKRKLINKIKFDLKYKISSDFNFFMQCFKKNKNFLYLNMVVAETISGGLSDKNRNKVFDENLKIIRQNNNSLILILNIWKKKLFNFIIIILKFILPKFLILFLLKIKYNKLLIPKDKI